MKEKYSYKGRVKIFGNTVNSGWTAQTYAVSAEKAKSNLAYQYKKTHNLVAATKVELPDELLVG